MTSDISMLPQPFAWVDIPAGNVTLKRNITLKTAEQQTFAVPAFAIAKYPLTNAQYAKFVEAEGYLHRQWWTNEGWRHKESNGWKEPRFWQSGHNQPDHPVVGVSWYEAVAFCLWLSEQIGEKVMLPTEQQWQRAAQGDTNHIYPWGDNFDIARCNFMTSGTTPVIRYEGIGDSPFGVVDLSGNVYEWCLTDYKYGTQDINSRAERRVLRGGSWAFSNEVYLRANYRYRDYPDAWVGYYGFRVACS